MSPKIDSTCRKFSLMVVLLVVCLNGNAQNNFADLDKIWPVNAKKPINLVALVYKDGKMIYQKQSGEDYNLKSREPIGDVSQWITAALVMTLVDEGKISLDDKVSTYIPIFATYGKSYITIRQCLGHQTGITDNHKGVAKLLDRKKFESLEEEVNSYAKKEIAANPGTTFFYGDMGPNIAGRVLEVVSKKRFELLVKQRIFAPLNMKNSSFNPEDDAPSPSNGAVSSAGDCMNFLSMILDKGTFMGKRILSEAAITQMQNIYTSKVPKKYIPKGMEGFEYGLGEWIKGPGPAGLATLLTAAFNGTWAYIDNCRKYAAILFTTALSDEEAKALHTQMKTQIERQLPGGCN